jgi:hypothetical protein
VSICAKKVKTNFNYFKNEKADCWILLISPSPADGPWCGRDALDGDGMGPIAETITLGGVISFSIAIE